MDKKMENEMEAGIVFGIWYFHLGVLWYPI